MADPQARSSWCMVSSLSHPGSPLRSAADDLGVGEGEEEGVGEVARPARAFLMGTSSDVEIATFT